MHIPCQWPVVASRNAPEPADEDGLLTGREGLVRWAARRLRAVLALRPKDGLQDSPQFRGLDRLCHVQIEPGCAGALPVLAPRVAAHGHQPAPASARLLPQPACDFEAVHL